MILSLFLAPFALACSPYPSPPTLETLAKQVDFIFVATTTGPEKKGGKKDEPLIPIEILHSLKGEAQGSGLYAQSRGGTCGFPLKEGVSYLMFAWKDDQGFYSSSSLTGTLDLSFAGPRLHELLKLAGKKPIAGEENCAALDTLEKRKKCSAAARLRLAKELKLSWLAGQGE